MCVFAQKVQKKKVNWATKKLEEQVKNTDVLKDGDKFNYNKMSKQVQHLRQGVRYTYKGKKGKREIYPFCKGSF